MGVSSSWSISSAASENTTLAPAPINSSRDTPPLMSDAQHPSLCAGLRVAHGVSDEDGPIRREHSPPTRPNSGTHQPCLSEPRTLDASTVVTTRALDVLPHPVLG
jgi:hypothetical protein